MELININLLPSDLSGKQKDKRKKSLIIKLTVGVLLIMIIITLGSVVSGFVKNNEQDLVSDELLQAQQRVDALKEQEGYLKTLKQRIATINKLKSEKSKEVASFELIDQLTPIGISVSPLSFDKNGNIELTGQSPSTNLLESFLENLTTPSKNQDSISKVVVDNLSYNQNKILKFSLKIHKK